MRDRSARDRRSRELAALLRAIGPEWDDCYVVWCYAVPEHGRGWIAYQMPNGHGGYLRPRNLGDRWPFARARVGEIRCGELAPEAWEVADRIGRGMVGVIDAVKAIAGKS